MKTVRNFRFPEKQQDFKQVYNLSHLKILLRQKEMQFTQFKLCNQFNIRTQVSHKKEKKDLLVASCKSCKAKLSYIKVYTGKIKHVFNLCYFNPMHDHKVTKAMCINQLYDFYKNKYNLLADEKLLDFAEAKFRDMFTRSEYVTLLTRVKEEGKCKPMLNTLQRFLGEEKNLITIDAMNPKKKIPGFLCYSSEKMREDYWAYGRFIYIHRLPYLISPDENSNQWLVLTLSGRNRNNSIIFYGAGISNNNTPQEVCRILRQFFRHMKVNHCESFITEKDPLFIQGINKFKVQTQFKGEHFWDLLIDVKQESKDKRKTLNQLMMATVKQQYKQLSKTYRGKLKGTESIRFEKFDKESYKYCLSAMNTSFVGLGILSSHFAKILEATSQKFPWQEHYSTFVFKFCSFIEQTEIDDFSTYAFSGECLHQPLQNALSVLSDNSFAFLLTQYRKTIFYNVINYQIVNTERINIEIQTQHSRVSLTKDRFEEDIVKCECQIKEKTGIPCSHIIKVCLYTGMDIEAQVDDFWMKSKEELVEKVKQSFSQKNTDI